MPYRLAKILVLDIETECDSGDYASNARPLLTEFGWLRKRPCKAN